ncbi:MAG: type IV secretion system DNA-binding domain-containing protein [Patescibacteria group bacterium]
MNDDKRVTYFGLTDARNQERKFGIYDEDRLRHMYAIGKTGMGKSTLLENMAIQDIQNGQGLAFLDPHGKTVELLLEHVPKHRIKDVIYIAPFDLEHPIAFNVLEDVGDPDPVRRQLIVSGLMSTFKKLWQDQWSARMEYILNYALLALLEIPDATLLDVNRMLSDKQFRNNVVRQLKEPTVKMYWEKEFAAYTDKVVAEAMPAIQNKVGQFISNSLIRNIIGQTKSSFDIREIMDQRKILLINLSIGRIGEDAVNLLGSLFVTKIYLAAMSRASIPDREMKHLPNFYLYVDEFQNFTNDSFAQILAQARKYKLSLIVAHQYVKQMTEVVHDAIFGNVGTMITFRVGADDGESLEKEFQPTFVVEDFVNLGRFQMYLKLMINGVTSGAFSAKGMGPWPSPTESYVDEILASSREQYTHPRKEVEDHILQWTLGGASGTAAGGAPKPVSSDNENMQGPVAANTNNAPREPRQQSSQPMQGPRDNRGGERGVDNRSQSSRPSQPQSPRQPERSRDGNRDERAPVREREQQPRRDMQQNSAHNSAPKVHNPFATAFKAVLEKPVEEKKDASTESSSSQQKRDIDPDVLKSMLGLQE